MGEVNGFQIEEDFDINSFKSVVINTIIENNEIVNQLDKNYIGCGGALLYDKVFPYLQIQRQSKQMNLLFVSE